SARGCKVRRQQAAANTRTLRSLTLRRSTLNIFRTSVQPNHSASVMASPSCRVPSPRPRRRARDRAEWRLHFGSARATAGPRVIDPLKKTVAAARRMPEGQATGRSIVLVGVHFRHLAVLIEKDEQPP